MKKKKNMVTETDNLTVIPKNDVLPVWLKIISNFEKSYLATSYVDLSSVWDPPFIEECAFCFLKEQLYKKKTIKRIYLVDDKREEKKIKAKIKNHPDLKAITRYMYKEDFEFRSINGLDSYYEDFAIIDNKFIFALELDGDRMYNRAIWIKPSQRIIYLYTTSYETLWHKLQYRQKK